MDHVPTTTQLLSQEDSACALASALRLSLLAANLLAALTMLGRQIALQLESDGPAAQGQTG